MLIGQVVSSCQLTLGLDHFDNLAAKSVLCRLSWHSFVRVCFPFVIDEKVSY